MLAIDTDVVVRCLIGDDPAQSAQARTLIDSENASRNPPATPEIESGSVTCAKMRSREAPRLIAARARVGFTPFNALRIVSTP